MTLPTQAVLGALLAAEGEVFGLEIVRTSGLGAGTIYPILQRLQTAGWVTARWEPAGQAHIEGRPPRRYYHLTNRGHARAVNALGSATPQRRALGRLLEAVDPSPRPGLVEGT
jgi:DNA-binding PadR family transcriptional regulator